MLHLRRGFFLPPTPRSRRLNTGRFRNFGPNNRILSIDHKDYIFIRALRVLLSTINNMPVILIAV